MSPILAVVLVVGLVGLLTLFRWWQPGLQARPLRHISQAGLCGGIVWLANLLIFGWGPVREVDAVLGGLGVLASVGLTLGFFSTLALYFEEFKGIMALFITGQPVPRTRARTNYVRYRTSPRKLPTVALPVPNASARLDWCAECERWHSVQEKHEHNLVN